MTQTAKEDKPDYRRKIKIPIVTVISDVHVGHPGAVWPGQFVNKDGNKISPNKKGRIEIELYRYPLEHIADALVEV